MIKIPKHTESVEKSIQISTPETDPLWTVDEVANYLRLNAETVRAMARQRKLPSIKVGGRVWRFKIKEIKDWLNETGHSTSIDE